MGGCVLLHLIGVILAFSSLVSSDMVRVTTAFSRVVLRDKVLLVRETGHLLLKVTPNLKVKGSPEEITTSHLCERIYIIGVSRNVSIPIGMCPHDQWEKISNGLWYQKMVPFDHKILDLRVDEQLTLQVSIVKELFMYRIVFLMHGTLFLSLASRMTRSSLAFGYACSLSSFIFFALLVLFQLMKRGPRVSSLFTYSSLLGLAACVIFSYGWWLIMEREFGCDEAIELKWMTVYLIGASFVTIALRRFVYTQHGSVDISTAHFFSWCIWILGALLILESSVDPLLAGGALISIILMLSMFKKITRLIFPSGGIIRMRE